MKSFVSALFWCLLTLTAFAQNGRIADPSYINASSWLCEGPKQAPVFTLPENRNVSLFVKREDFTPSDVVGRGGVKYFRNGGFPASNTFRWFESKQLKGGTVDNVNYPGETLSVQEWIDFAAREPLHGIEIDEFMEGEWRVRTSSPQYIAFTQKRRDMYVAAGRVPPTFECYGNFDMPLARDWKIDGVYRGPTSNAFQQYYASQSAARNVAPGYYGQHYGTCWPSIKYYPERPYTADEYFQFKWAMEVLAKGLNQGDRLGFVTAPLIESLPGSTVPAGSTHNGVSFSRRVNNPPGYVTTTPHPHYDYDLAKAMCFMGLVVGTDVIVWDSPLAYGVDPNTIYRPLTHDSIESIWRPDTPGTPPPYAPNGGRGYAPERLTFYDMVYAAAHLYKQMEATAGVSWKYLRYRVGNNAWIELQANGTDGLFHAAARRGDCMGRVKGSAGSFFYFNPYKGKHEYETVTVEIGGKQFTNTLQGSVIHGFNVTI